ncbi:glycerophosphodiester phosphodiesterase [Peterkaempfera bronchialis]|uniref:Glycerophosphodiester phosphodiesterase n=1 Tax=Peterkaempfera bronchialis TaxID=2126346 RepID=A0A345SRU7_9ACTN|nr:glycerophosphodiester phosphodiesterase [Peterkaempfera bronchialis]AXI76452.1 glycerophosphodiester phosphodiesterase [Peterkaempfera bronchialis]
MHPGIPRPAEPRPAEPRPAALRAVAHRGDPYRHRENTLPSLRSALAAGADAVEVDVRLTRDGIPVLLHDPTLRRLWGLDRPLADLTLAELRRLGGPAAAPRIPTLAEALTAFADAPPTRTGRPPLLMVDLDDAGPAAATCAEVARLGAADRVVYCGPPSAMLAVRHHAPAAEVSLTWQTPLAPPPALLADLRPHLLNLPFGLVTPALVDRARRTGLQVSAWTVDVRRTMARLLRTGAVSLTTNRIGVLRALIDATATAPPG